MSAGRVLAVALLTAAFLAPAPARAQEVARERLPNGLRVIVRENPTAPVVAVALLVAMGTRWETAADAGISNFVHAVMVKGTTRRGGAEIAQAVAALGGRISAAGDVDYSGIQGAALARFWRELLGITAELALEPKLAPEEVAREREWLLSRVQKRRDNAPARAFDEFYAALYGPHPYGLPPLGSAASLRRIDHAAIVAHYRAFYRPERMVLAVSGQVAAPEVLAEARRLFGGLTRGASPPAPALPAPKPAGGRLVVTQPAQQMQILLGGLGPTMTEPDHAAVKVLATLLGGGMASRLFSELRDRQGLAYTASAFYEPMHGPGALALYLGTAPATLARAEAALGREVERIRAEPPSAAELTRAKGYLLGRYAMDRRTNERQAWYLAYYTLQGVGADYPARYRRAVQAVTAADVQRAAQRYLARPTTLVLGPR